ncbi:MAG: MBL fold metallo-hydrolase [Bacteroidales bacterium]|nr:MBL fold metallo-hydrolase [Bacteroidales bacterium]
MNIIKAIPLIPEIWKIDGGVAFGVVPKNLWASLYPSDEHNLITLVNRCLLLELADQLILINTGFGQKRDDKYYQYKFILERHNLKELIQQAGYHVNDITDVIFTHLHDDHCGGATEKLNDKLRLIFPQANHWVSQEQLYHFFHANPRERASFFEDNILPILKLGKLKVVHAQDSTVAGLPYLLTHGHTRGQLLPYFTWKNQTYLYASDFIPSISHIQPVWCASVDTQPLVAIEEKKFFLQKALEKNIFLFFEHDSMNESAKILLTEKGFKGEKFLFPKS